MRRSLISLSIALSILAIILLPMAASASGLSVNGHFTFINKQVIANGLLEPVTLLQDDGTDIPAGLKLTKGIPFISPSEVKKGDTVTIKVSATNESTNTINYSLTVTVNGKTAGNPQVLKLEPAGKKDITFQVTASETGNNDVKVGNLQGFFTVSSGSFFDSLPIYLWIFFGVIAVVIIMLVVLMVMKPPKKKAGALADQAKKQGKLAGKPSKSGAKDIQSGLGMQRSGIPGVPEGAFGMQVPPHTQDIPGMQGFPQQPGIQQPFQGQPGMQQQFQPSQPGGMQPQPGIQQPGMQQPFQGQPGMQQPFQPNQPGGMQPQPGIQQPGMQQPFQGQPGMQQPGIRSPQFPTAQPMPGAPQSPQQPMQGIQPGMGPQVAPQAGMPFGMQSQQPPMPQGMMPTPAPGMPQTLPPTMQPPMPTSMHPGIQSGMPPMAGGYQSMGMPKFSVSNLTITPNNVKVGEQVNISIIVSNNGVQTGKYSVVLRVGGVVENISDLTLPPGASQTASFTVVKDAPGDYYADIDGLGGFFTVIPLNPPAFHVTNFTVGPERVRQGQPVTVTASVTNTGEITGSHTLILRVKGIAESQRDITLGPGKMENVEFQIIKDTPGFYPVSLENWTGKFVVEMDWTG